MRRSYKVVPAGSGQWNQHFAIRSGDRILCESLGLTWDQADRLCDDFEAERQRSLRLDPPAEMEGERG